VGISGSMAEVDALLHMTGRAPCTEEVMERLRIARGNASMSLRALLDWGMVSRTIRRGPDGPELAYAWCPIPAALGLPGGRYEVAGGRFVP
jgi:predicted transcriptional regulator